MLSPSQFKNDFVPSNSHHLGLFLPIVNMLLQYSTLYIAQCLLYKEGVPYWTFMAMTMCCAIDSMPQPFHYKPLYYHICHNPSILRWM